MLTLKTPPTALPVTLAEAKLFLRVGGCYDLASASGYTAEDDVVTIAIRAATQALDGEAGILGRCLMAQTWTLTLDRFDREIALPLAPCVSVGRVAYIDANGADATLDPSIWRVYGLGALGGATIRPAPGKSWPATFYGPGAVSIDFTAGFGAAPSDVPEPLRQAILLHVEAIYRATPRSPEYDLLVEPYRAWSFA